MGMRAMWAPDTPDMFTAAIACDYGQQFLLVERLPGGGWDWIAWSGHETERALHGVAENAAAAMKAAECAAATLSAARVSFATDRNPLLQPACERPN